MVDGNGSLKAAYDLALTRGFEAPSKSPWVLGFNNAAQGIVASANPLQYSAGGPAFKNG